MSQHDMVIDNGPGLAVRTDMNGAIQALASSSAGPIEPTVKYAGQLWLDTTVMPNGALRVRNLANTDWEVPTLPGVRTTDLVLTDATGVKRGQLYQDPGTSSPSWSSFDAAGLLLSAGTVFTTGNSPSLLAANGYQKFPSGIIIQGGNATTNAGGDQIIAFPTAFPNAVIAVTATVDTGSGIGGNAFFGIIVHSFSSSTVSFQARVMSPGAVAVAQIGFRWIAIGY